MDLPTIERNDSDLDHELAFRGTVQSLTDAARRGPHDPHVGRHMLPHGNGGRTLSEPHPGQGPPTKRERRLYDRVAVQCRGACMAEDVVSSVTIEDLSPTGARLQTHGRLDVETRAALRLLLPPPVRRHKRGATRPVTREMILLDAQVVWISDHQVGLRLRPMPTKSRRALRQLMRTGRDCN